MSSVAYQDGYLGMLLFHIYGFYSHIHGLSFLHEWAKWPALGRWAWLPLAGLKKRGGPNWKLRSVHLRKTSMDEMAVWSFHLPRFAQNGSSLLSLVLQSSPSLFCWNLLLAASSWRELIFFGLLLLFCGCRILNKREQKAWELNP